MKNETANRSFRSALTTITLVGLLAGATACGGDDSATANEAEAGVAASVTAEIENELGTALPGINTLPQTETNDPTDAQGEDSPADTDAPSIAPEGNDVDDGSTPETPTTSTAPVVTLPGGVTPTSPTLPPANIPTTKAPVATLPGGVTATLPNLSAPNLPSTSTATNTVTFDFVSVNPQRNDALLEVFVSVSGTGRPERLGVQYRVTGALIRTAWLTFDQQLDPNTSAWSAIVYSDADPCSLLFQIPPSTTIYRARPESC